MWNWPSFQHSSFSCRIEHTVQVRIGVMSWFMSYTQSCTSNFKMNQFYKIFTPECTFKIGYLEFVSKIITQNERLTRAPSHHSAIQHTITHPPTSPPLRLTCQHARPSFQNGSRQQKWQPQRGLEMIRDSRPIVRPKIQLFNPLSPCGFCLNGLVYAIWVMFSNSTWTHWQAAHCINSACSFRY